MTSPPLLLELDLTEPPVDPGADPVARLSTRNRRLLRPTLRALHEAGADRRVAGLLARVGGPLPWGLAEELRLAVRAFAETGKPCVAWAEGFGEGPGSMAGYVLATAFDEIWLQPGSGVGLLGVGLEATFLRGALDRIGVELEVEQRHEFKNAPDQLTRTEPTPAHREALERVVESVSAEAVATIAVGRRLDPNRVRELVDGGPWTAVEAAASGLVDRLGYRDEVLAAVRSRLGGEATLLFADRWRLRAPRLPRRHRGRVGLVEVRGGIGPGRSRRGPMGQQAGSDTVSAQLRSAAADEHVRAVVVRVDSPGGSAVASETIWRAVGQVQETGKPVIVSMGEVAASGGYYIACPADLIVAAPGTLTGSIGVFGGKLVARDLLDRIGVTSTPVAEGDHALMFSSRRGFSPAERERLAALIDAVYDDFVAKVASGRRRPVAEVEAVARGRVWTGRDALDVGLVDHLGGLRTAVDLARGRAGLPADSPVVPAVHLSPLARLSRPRNSDDPRVSGAAWSGLGDLATALGQPPGVELRMLPLRLR